jgi:pimeloyl-ACP methyl ester carboxylesterase
MTTTSLLPDVGTELREGYAEIGDQRLHYVEAGDGPLIVLLHGFPEFWFAWRRQIEPLAAAGFRVVAPDTRGYNCLLYNLRAHETCADLVCRLLLE